MKLKFIFFLLSIFIFNNYYSQIAITEVYYDTPYNEKLKFGNQQNGYVEAVKHHRGEFIEIYNYSDKDINLKSWYLQDKQGIFWFPEKTIKSGEFMVVAYSTLPANTTPFTEYFSSTVGKESQIILQDKIILRNKREKIELGYSLNEYRLLSKSFAEWEQRDTPAINFIQNIWQTPHLFYTIPSIQYYSNPLPPDPNNSDIYNNYMAAPNPLAATYKPDTQNYDDLVKNDYQEFYSFLDWSNNVKALIDNVCVISIGKIEQAPTGTYTNTGKCFNYDDVGNETDAYNCVANSNTNPSTGYTVDELEAISNSIILYPNPTTASSQYNVTISWSGVALNKIYNLQVYSSAGMSVYNYNPITGINTTSFNLQSQLPGTFVANFVLNTGQIVSKNILKW